MLLNPSVNRLYDIYIQTSGVCTDTRKITPGGMFFALKGENFDGNDFAAQAFMQGARKVVMDNEEKAGKCAGTLREISQETGPDDIILVPDVLGALQELASFHRRQFHIPVIALTGTNGKTTTKELITAVLSRKFRVVSTAGNLNNHIGVPLTLLGIRQDTHIAVVEMGASAPGEIKRLVEIVSPTFGLITNVGKAHLLGFGSFEGVIKTKGELYDYLQKHKKIAFVNTDNPYLVEMAEKRSGMSIVPYGVKNDGARIVPATKENPFLKLVIPNPCLLSVCGNMDNSMCECLAREQGMTRENCGPEYLEIDTRLIGNYNADNVMAALCVGSYFSVLATDAIAAIEGYVPSNSRSQMNRTGRNTLIIDAYNANPTSMQAALENFRGLELNNKCLILGDMLELGTDSLLEHERILTLALSLSPETVYLVGEEFRRACASVVGEMEDGIKTGSAPAQKGPVRWFPDSGALHDFLSQAHVQGKTFLIKGSRGMRLEKVLDTL